jgi:hypothetical protein
MAFHRLQVEIVQHSHDQTLFVWNGLPSSRNSMFATGPEAFFPLNLKSPLHTVEEDIAGPVDPNYGLRISLSIYEVHEQRGKHKLEGLGVEVALQFQIKDEKLMIGILGNGPWPGNKSLAIVLKPISSAIGSQRKQFKRITHDVIELPRFIWKAPEVIFIE